MAVHGVDGRAITNPENAQNFSHAEIKKAADLMNPAGLEGAHAAWSALSAAVGSAGERFGSALQRAVDQRWEGAAADAAVRGVREFVTQLTELGAALGRQSEPLTAAGSAAAHFKAAIPDVVSEAGNSTAPEDRNAREEQARDDMNRLYIQPYGATAPRIPTLPSPVGPGGGGMIDGLLGGGGRPGFASVPPDGARPVTGPGATEGVSGADRVDLIGSSTSADQGGEGQASTEVQPGAQADNDVQPGAGVHAGAGAQIGSGLQPENSAQSENGAGPKQTPQPENTTEPGNTAEPESGAHPVTDNRPEPEAQSEGEVPQGALPEPGTQSDGGGEPTDGAAAETGPHGSMGAKSETAAGAGAGSNQGPSSGENGASAPLQPHAEPDSVAAQSASSSPTPSPPTPSSSSPMPSSPPATAPAPTLPTPTTPFTPTTPTTPFTPFTPFTPTAPLGASPVASPPPPFAPAALHDTSARPTPPPLGPTITPPTPPPSPGSSVPAQPAAAPNTAPPSGVPVRPGAPGATGYAGLMPSTPRTRTEEDGEHRSARYLRSEEHGQELIGETPKTVPPALGAD